MTPLTLVALLGLVYSLLYLADTLLRTQPSTATRYLLTLRRLGLEVSLLTVRWSTTRYNSSLHWVAGLRPGLTKIWFSLGGLVSCLIMVPSCLLLLLSLYQHLQPSPLPSQPLLQPVLPGVNLPPSHLLHYILALLMASVYHEAGHAVAAFNCNLRMSSAGVMVVAMFPAAFVELPTAELESRTAWQQLRVFSGGVWHNIVLAATASLFSLSLHLLLCPLYTTGLGLTVTSLSPASSLSGPSGLMEGQVMRAVQGQKVTTRRDLSLVLASILAKPQPGLCVSDEVATELQVSAPHSCCPPERTDSLCFTSAGSHDKCLPVRALLARTGGVWCDETCGAQCWTPSLEINSTKLIIVTRRNERDFLYIGNPGLLYTELTVSEFVPVFDWLPLSAPDIIVKFLSYLSAFSAGLAVLNVVPSYLLDGQHITRVLVEILLQHKSDVTRLTVTAALTVLGTLLIAANIILGLAGLASGSVITNPMM